MTADRLRAWAKSLREFNEQAGGSVEIGVEVEDDYEVDLGAFGYQSMTVCLYNEYYAIDVDEVLDQLPMQRGDFEEMAEELERIANTLDESDTGQPLIEDEAEEPSGGSVEAFLAAIDRNKV